MPKPELGAEQRTAMAHRIERCARELRMIVRQECERDAEDLVNCILEDLALLDEKRARREDREARSVHVQAALSSRLKGGR